MENTKGTKMKGKRIAIVAVIVLLGLALVLTACKPKIVETPVARSVTACYFPPGGRQFVAGSGCEIEMLSGSTLDIQSGASVGWSTTSGAGITTNYLTATTAISAAKAIVSGDLSVRAITATGQISVARATVSGDLSARNITATGSISGASLTVNGASAFGGLATFSNDVSARNITSTSQIAVADGAVGTPSIAFASDTNSGIYAIGADDWALSVGGTRRLELDTSGLNLNGGQFNVPDGTAAAPIIRFTNDIDTGLYRSSTNTLGIAANGAAELWIAPDQLLMGAADNTMAAGAADSTVAGGGLNTMSAKWGFIGGGSGNNISGPTIADDSRYSVVAGGNTNVITSTGDDLAIVGGYGNRIIDATDYGFVGGGYHNVISGSANSTVLAGGAENIASGSWSVVPGGYSNFASGDFSFAAGRRAQAIHQGAFVFADSTDADFTSPITDSFNVRAAGGVLVTGAVTATAQVDAAALSVSGVAFTGPMKYGYVASQADGAAITHGFATTPTVCLITPQTATITATVNTIGATTFTANVGATGPVYWMCGQ